MATRKLRKKKKIDWRIYKMHCGLGWPGEEWDYFPSEKEALKSFAKDYAEPGTLFRLVKVTELLEELG